MYEDALVKIIYQMRKYHKKMQKKRELAKKKKADTSKKKKSWQRATTKAKVVGALAAAAKDAAPKKPEPAPTQKDSLAATAPLPAKVPVLETQASNVTDLSRQSTDINRAQSMDLTMNLENTMPVAAHLDQITE